VPRLRALLAGLVLTAPAFTSVLAAPAPACAAGPGPRAALVVDTGASVTTYCVALGASSVDGLELIRLAGRQHGLAYSFGFGGQAVCSLAGVGPSGGDCFAEYPDFWGFWRGNGSGGWSWSSSGAGGVSVGGGDIEGWTWGSGDSGSTHPAPPALAFDDVCEPSGGGGAGSGGGSGGAGGSQGGGDSGGGDAGLVEPGNDEEAAGSDDGAQSEGRSPSRSKAEPRRERDRPTPSPSERAAPDGPDIRAAGARADDPPGGPPAATYLAVVAIAVLVVGGRLRLRSRGPAR
jgi:hypothetical protein